MSSDVESESSPAQTSPRQALLGIFILCQLAFLVVSNLLGFVKSLPDQLEDKPKALVQRAVPGLTDENTHAGNWIRQVEKNSQRWIQLTGQYQDWALYTTVSKSTGFPAVALLWDDGFWETPFIKGTTFAYDEKNGFHLCASWNPSATRDLPLPVMCELGILTAASPWEAACLTAASRLRIDDEPSRIEFLLSENEPSDLHNYVRFGKCRLRRYEGQMYLNLQPGKEETPGDLAERCNRELRSFASSNSWTQPPALAYLRWRLDRWRADNPDQAMPKQVILFERFYRIRGPEETPRGWDGPVLYPIARWRPNPDDPDARGFLEPFDFTEQRFVPGL